MITQAPTGLVAGIDIGGTRTKMGIVELATGRVLGSRVFATERTDEAIFLDNLAGAASSLAAEVGAPRAAGVSIGSYVFSDGSIDGMSSFVRFLTHGYPLAGRVSQALDLPARVDNDARLIALAETREGAGRGAGRVLTLTLGTGVGVGLCEGGHPVGQDSHIHLAGHVRVREGGEVTGLDEEPCYCGLTGCFESTCSGTSLAKLARAWLGTTISNEWLFELAEARDAAATEVLGYYLEMLSRALNQYVYLYCPDVIVLAGGVAKGLAPYRQRLQDMLVASVWEGQRTEVRMGTLEEDAGIVGAASLFAR